jgi:hypothetical protein
MRGLALKLARNAATPSRSTTRWVREENDRSVGMRSPTRPRRGGEWQGEKAAPGGLERQPPSPLLARGRRRGRCRRLRGRGGGAREMDESPVGTRKSPGQGRRLFATLNGPPWAGNLPSPGSSKRVQLGREGFQARDVGAESRRFITSNRPTVQSGGVGRPDGYASKTRSIARRITCGSVQ